MKSLRPVRGMYLTGLIFIIVAVAGLYAWLLTISGIAQDTVSLINGLHSERWVVLLVINVFLLFVGCFLDPASALIMLTPLLAPVAASLGINPIHFGCHRGAEPDYRNLSPPVRPEHLCHPSAVQPSATLCSGLIPFVTLAVIALMLVTYVLEISLWIMRLLS